MRRETFLCAVLCAACAEDASSPRPRDITIRFAALYDGAPFGCATPLSLGEPASAATMTDVRFYVSNPALVTADGRELPITLDSDGVWQSERIGLLDFEAGCETAGTPETRSVLEGTVADEPAVGLAFDLGVPFDVNHLNSSEAEAPLNLPAMFWGWQAGYRFVRLELVLDGGSAWFFHLGSVGCESDSSVRPPDSCTRPNRTRLRLAAFDAAKDTVVFDLNAFFSKVDLHANVDKSPPGCMCDLAETADCERPLANLGIEWATGAASPNTATAFRVVRAP